VLGALLGFGVAGMQRADRRKVAVLTGLMIAAVVIAAVALPRFTASIEGRVFNHPYTQVARTSGPQRLTDELSTRPLSLALGNGLGSTSRELAKSGGVGGVDTYDNQFIDSIFDIGLVPVLLAALMLCCAIAGAKPSRRKVFLPAVIASVGMLAFFDGLGWPSFAVLFWFLIGAISARDVA
jgi:O-antigen ligase